MAEDPHNPRAFPSGAINDRFGGMTLLDHYAGQALAGVLANPQMNKNSRKEDVAIACFDAAEGMIAERARRMGRAA